jgi:hypothetical protein
MLLPLSYFGFYFIEPPLDITPGLPYTACVGTGLPKVLAPFVYIPLILAVYF